MKEEVKLKKNEVKQLAKENFAEKKQEVKTKVVS